MYDLPSKTYGNSNNLKLRKGDILYKITDAKDNIVMFIGEGSGDGAPRHKKSLGMRLLLVPTNSWRNFYDYVYLPDSYRRGRLF